MIGDEVLARRVGVPFATAFRSGTSPLLIDNLGQANGERRWYSRVATHWRWRKGLNPFHREGGSSGKSFDLRAHWTSAYLPSPASSSIVETAGAPRIGAH